MTNAQTQHTPGPRPAFLQRSFRNTREIIAAFQALTTAEAWAVDRWLLIASQFGSMTCEERGLYDWINDSDDALAKVTP